MLVLTPVLSITASSDAGEKICTICMSAASRPFSSLSIAINDQNLDPCRFLHFLRAFESYSRCDVDERDHNLQEASISHAASPGIFTHYLNGQQKECQNASIEQTLPLSLRHFPLLAG